MHRFAAWIRSRYWAERPVWWILYFTLWSLNQLFAGVGWLIQEAYGQSKHALQEFLRRNLLLVLLVGALALVYVAEPRMLGPLLQLGVVLVVMWFGLRLVWRSAFPPKKRNNKHP